MRGEEGGKVEQTGVKPFSMWGKQCTGRDSTRPNVISCIPVSCGLVEGGPCTVDVDERMN